DVLLDQNFGRTPADYAAWVAPACKILTGPTYALLRPQFAAVREQALRRRQEFAGVRNVLITLGGGDHRGLNAHCLDLLAEAGEGAGITVTIVAPRLQMDALRRQATGLPVKVDILCEVEDMASLMLAADIA